MSINEFFLHFTALTNTKTYNLIPLYILKDFTEGFVHISFTFIYNKDFILKNMVKMHIFKTMSLFFSISAALTYTNTYSLIPLYILKDFTEGFVHISFTFIYTRFYS